MIVFLGIPAVLILTFISFILIHCCKKKPKVQEFGFKMKDKIVFDTLIPMMIVSSLSFAVEAGVGRAFSSEIDRPQPKGF
jgi:hypothetical protein